MLNRRCRAKPLYDESRIAGTSGANFELISLFRRRMRLPAGKGRSLTSGKRKPVTSLRNWPIGTTCPG
jgi:hypothetical protein